MVCLQVGLVGLIPIVGYIILFVCYQIGIGKIDKIIGKLASFVLDSGVDFLIDNIFRFIVVVDIVLLIFLVPDFRKLFILYEGLVVLQPTLVLDEISMLGLFETHQFEFIN